MKYWIMTISICALTALNAETYHFESSENPQYPRGNPEPSSYYTNEEPSHHEYFPPGYQDYPPEQGPNWDREPVYTQDQYQYRYYKNPNAYYYPQNQYQNQGYQNQKYQNQGYQNQRYQNQGYQNQNYYAPQGGYQGGSGY